jgi:hypothetical protein
MGISSDGILYFGFQVGGEDEPPDWMDGFDNFDDFLVSLAGLPSDSPYEVRKKVIEACPVELQLFCSYDYPMYILGVRGAEHRANRGYIVEIGTGQLAVDPAKIEAAKAWCEAQNNIEWQEPKWLLCSMYG